MSQPSNPANVKAELEGLIRGLTKSPPGGHSELVVGGQNVVIADLVKELQGHAAKYHAVEQTEKQHKTALAERDAIEEQAVSRCQQVRAAVKGALGATNPALADYDIAPNKQRRALTTEEEAAKVAKAKATRAARHTMGKRQKEAIKGQVPPGGSPPNG
jgi:hypothetical protein